MAARGALLLLLVLAMASAAGSASQAGSASHADSPCSCYRCNARRQGVTGALAPALATLVTFERLETKSAVKTAPLVASDGTLFVSTEGGALLAYARRTMPATGDMWNPSPVQYALDWEKQEIFSTANTATPAIAAGAALAPLGLPYVVLLASGQHVAAVDGSGNQLWKRDLCDFWNSASDCSSNLNVGTSSPAVSADGGTVYVCTAGGGACFALVTTTGNQAWEAEGIYYQAGYSYVASLALSPAGHRLYVPSANTYELVELSANTTSTTEPAGSFVNRLNLEHQLHSTPAVAGSGDIYVCMQSGQLARITPDGTLVWKRPELSEVTSGAYCVTTAKKPDASMTSPAVVPTASIAGIPSRYRGTHPPLTPVASYAGPPSSLQTTGYYPGLTVGSSICLAS